MAEDPQLDQSRKNPCTRRSEKDTTIEVGSDTKRSKVFGVGNISDEDLKCFSYNTGCSLNREVCRF